MINGMDQEAEKIKIDSFKLCWYMRGGLTYEECMFLSLKEHEMIGKIIKENLEVTKKSGMPFF